MCVLLFDSNAAAVLSASGQLSPYFALIFMTGIPSLADITSASIEMPARFASSVMLSNNMDGKPKARIWIANESWRSIWALFATMITKFKVLLLKKCRTTCSSSE